MSQPIAYILDIETKPMKAWVWGRRDVQIGLNQIDEEWSIIAFAAKKLGAPASATKYMDLRKQKDKCNDKRLIATLWEILDETDVLITQNGEKFDARKFNARCIMWGLPPPSPYRHIDTYKIAHRIADFTSNSLEYLTAKLCTKYKKLSHKKFPGMSLWTECLKDNLEAWNEMRTYNVHDVLSTEELYIKLRPWAPKPMAKAFSFLDTSTLNCETCGQSDTIEKNGVRVGKQRYRCLNCGASTTGKENVNGRR